MTYSREFKGFERGGYGAIFFGIVVIASTWIFWDWLATQHEPLPPTLLSLFSVVSGVGATLLSIHYSSGKWYQSYQRFKELGITDAEPNRRGADENQNALYMAALRKANRHIILSGTKLSGWFVTVKDGFREVLIEKVKTVGLIEIFLLDPESRHFSSRLEVEGGAEERKEYIARCVMCYKELQKLLSEAEISAKLGSEFKVYFYDETPLPLVWIDSQLFFAQYLPEIENQFSPQLILSEGGEYAEQVKTSVERLRNSAKTMDSHGEIVDKIQYLERLNSQEKGE